MNNIFEQLVLISEEKKQLENELKKQRSDFEDSIALQQAQYEDVLDKEQKLRQEALMELEAENKSSEKVGNKTISKQVKRTLKVNDPLILRTSLENINTEEYGVDKNNIKDCFETVLSIKDKKLINDLIDSYEKVEGKLLEGVEAIETKFIVIK